MDDEYKIQEKSREEQEHHDEKGQRVFFISLMVWLSEIVHDLYSKAVHDHLFDYIVFVLSGNVDGKFVPEVFDTPISPSDQ